MRFRSSAVRFQKRVKNVILGRIETIQFLYHSRKLFSFFSSPERHICLLIVMLSQANSSPYHCQSDYSDSDTMSSGTSIIQGPLPISSNNGRGKKTKRSDDIQPQRGKKRSKKNMWERERRERLAEDFAGLQQALSAYGVLASSKHEILEKAKEVIMEYISKLSPSSISNEFASNRSNFPELTSITPVRFLRTSRILANSVFFSHCPRLISFTRLLTKKFCILLTIRSPAISPNRLSFTLQ